MKSLLEKVFERRMIKYLGMGNPIDAWQAWISGFQITHLSFKMNLRKENIYVARINSGDLYPISYSYSLVLSLREIMLVMFGHPLGRWEEARLETQTILHYNI